MKKIGMALVLLAGLLAVPLPVAAAVPKTTDAKTLVTWIDWHSCQSCAFSRLSSTQQSSVKAYLSPDHFRRGPRVEAPAPTPLAAAATTAGAETCQFGVKGRLDMLNTLGVTLWSYVMETDRCWDSSGVFTYVATRRYVTNVITFWSFDKIEKTETGGVGSTRWDVFTQDQMKFCIFAGFGCFRYSYPYLHLQSPNPFMPAQGPAYYLLTGGGNV